MRRPQSRAQAMKRGEFVAAIVLAVSFLAVIVPAAIKLSHTTLADSAALYGDR